MSDFAEDRLYLHEPCHTSNCEMQAGSAYLQNLGKPHSTDHASACSRVKPHMPSRQAIVSALRLSVEQVEVVVTPQLICYQSKDTYAFITRLPFQVND